jgi:acetyl-CoA carboxylase carboxyl transferase subunit beta
LAWVRFRKKEMPGGLWTKCPSCGEMLFTKDLIEALKICAKCGHHLTATVDERIAFTCDPGSFEELYTDLEPVDRLGFSDKAPYGETLERNQQKTGRKEAMAIGTGTVKGRPLVLGVMDFQFLGGSMGVVVGEKVALAVETAQERDLPLVLVSASGGARMHEGTLSLMQLAKTCAVLARFGDRGGLYISLVTHPTTGGVTASFATMADVILAEPNALIGFAGPRVIQNTIRQELPEGFQRSEFLLERGQIDSIVKRDEIPATLSRLMDYLKPESGRAPHGPGAAGRSQPDGASGQGNGTIPRSARDASSPASGTSRLPPDEPRAEAAAPEKVKKSRS